MSLFQDPPMTERQRGLAVMLMAVLLGVLTVLVWNGDTEAFDQALRTAALKANSSASVQIWQDITVLGSVAVITTLTLLSLATFAILRQWLAVKALTVAMLGAMVFDNGMKWLVHRPRAQEVYAGTMPTSFSFPSGHALFSFTFYLTMAALLSRQSPQPWKAMIWSIGSLLVTLIGASRIFLGVHYGSDVLAGYLISGLWLIVLLKWPSKARPWPLDTQ